jgi:hypothetical protein
MLYAWIGYLKPDAGPIPQSVRNVNDFLGQPLLNIHFTERSMTPLASARG